MHKINNTKIKSIIEKIKRYCILQKRCEMDVIIKMNTYKLPIIHQNKIMENLRKEKYLDEDDFCLAFCRGKFRIKKWGKIKIIHALKKKNIATNSIEKGIKTINQDEYLSTLKKLLIQKKKQLETKKEKRKKIKIANFLIQKGFESFLVWQNLNEMYEN